MQLSMSLPGALQRPCFPRQEAAELDWCVSSTAQHYTSPNADPGVPHQQEFQLRPLGAVAGQRVFLNDLLLKAILPF